MPRLALWTALGAAVWAASCGRAAGMRSPSAPARPGGAAHTPAAYAARLPAQPGKFAGAFTRLSGTGDVDGEQLSDVKTCSGCHPDVFAMQQASAHAFSSFNNPIYRYSVDRLRRLAGKRASRVCAGCHDVALLIDGQIDRPVRPDDPRAHTGVSCRLCHGIQSATVDGNGSFVLSRKPIPLPNGSSESIEIHKRAAAPLDGVELCGSCHRGFLSGQSGNHDFLLGIDDLAAWRSSAFNHSELSRVDDAIPEQTCRDCHMPLVDAPLGDMAAKHGKIHSHRFLGGHTWLASMLGDKAQLAAQQAFLRGAASIDVAAAATDHHWTLPADGAPVMPGATLMLDVVLRNLRVGHRFPGGTTDDQDTFVELDVRDAHGHLLGRSGEGEHPHRLRTLVGDQKAHPVLAHSTHDFYAPMIDNTLGPRDVELVRYMFHVPKDLTPAAQPLQVQARLIHRSRNRDLQAAVCKEMATPRSQAFSRMQEQLRHLVLDPCKPEPKTLVAETLVWLGRGAAARAAESKMAHKPTWRRLYERGLGLNKMLPSTATEARASFDAALKAAEMEHATPQQRGQIVAGIAAMYAGMGKIDLTKKWADRAEALVPGDVAVAMIRAGVYQRWFHADLAAPYLAAATGAAPENVNGWQQYSQVLLSLQNYKMALKAAKNGLGLRPRDTDLLRVQALALDGLGLHGAARVAQAAYEAQKRPYRTLEISASCADIDQECSRELLPVHVHQVVPVTDHAGGGMAQHGAGQP